MWTKLVDLTVLVGEWLLDRLDALVARASLIGTAPTFQPRDFAWTRALEAGWSTMRSELETILEYRGELPNFQDISTDQASITDDDRWKTYFLYGFGHRSDANCERCPETARLVAAVPGMQTAMFSILAPGKHIPEHCGPYKGLLRYHLALKVPTDSAGCRIRIGDRVTTWTEGESLMFDDTFEHEVWNDTDEERVVLFLDIARPLRFPVNVLNRFVLRAIAVSPFVADAKRRQRAWEREFSARGTPPRLGPPPTVRVLPRAEAFRSSSEE